MKKILVPLDGSPLAEQALPAVRSLLEQGVEEAVLFAVGEAPRATPAGRRRGLRRPVPLASMPGTFPRGAIPATPRAYAETRDQAIEREEHELLDYLEDIAPRLRDTGRKVTTVARLGDPAREIIDYAGRNGCDLIVMTTHGRSGLRAVVQGSVMERVLQSGVAPVLALRPRAPATGDPPSDAS